MLRQIFKFYPRRNFYNSAVWRDSKNEVTTTPKQESQTTSTPPQEPEVQRVVPLDFVPNKFEKFILVYSGKYKSKDEIPPRIGYSTLDTAKSKVRIKIANYLMVATVFLLGGSVLMGKKHAKEGDSIVARGMARQKKLMEEAGIKRDY